MSSLRRRPWLTPFLLAALVAGACTDSPTGPVAPVPEGALRLSDSVFTRGAVVRARVRAPDGYAVVPSSVIWTVVAGEATLVNLDGDDDSVDVALRAAGAFQLRASYTLRSLGAGSSLSSAVPTRRPNGDVGVVAARAVTVALPRLDYVAVPATSNTAGAPLAEVRVAVTDARGTVITTATDSVVLALDPTSGASGATLLGTLRAKPVAGIATFTGLSIRKAGVGYRLIASSPTLDITDTTLTTIVAGAPSAAQSTVVFAESELGEGESTTVTVTLRDAYGNLVLDGTPAAFTSAASAGDFGAFTCVNGVCTATYTAPTTPGSATVSVSIGGTPVGPSGTPLTVEVVDRTPPVITGPSGGAGAMSSEVALGENATEVHTFSANEPVTWRVSGGADGAKFEIDSVTGTLRFIAPPDYEAPADSDGNNTYTLTVEARDAAGNVTTQTITVTVTDVDEDDGEDPPPSDGSLVVGPSVAEKLPGGTQQFTVEGGTGPFTWTVNGVEGGDATFGTITADGLFTAPGSVPSPATYKVCVTDANGETGCATITISDVPSAGGDLIVINDINWGYVSGPSGFQGYPNLKYPGNKVFVKNLVNFPTSGSRKAGTKVWFFNEGNNEGKDIMPATGFKEATEVITAEGFTVESKNAHADLESIPADVKVIFLMMPGTAFAKAEYNALKRFALQGGRIAYIGENGVSYAYGLSLQVDFITAMGGKMTNTGGCEARGVIVTLEPHQLSTGIGSDDATGFFMNCVSPLNLGPNDYAIFRDPVTKNVMVGAAKIDFTPIP